MRRRVYDYGPDRLLSLHHRDEGRQYYLFDTLGSVVDLTTPEGSVQVRAVTLIDGTVFTVIDGKRGPGAGWGQTA